MVAVVCPGTILVRNPADPLAQASRASHFALCEANGQMNTTLRLVRRTELRATSKTVH